jgi:hypothetical protein
MAAAKDAAHLAAADLSNPEAIRKAAQEAALKAGATKEEAEAKSIHASVAAMEAAAVRRARAKKDEQVSTPQRKPKQPAAKTKTPVEHQSPLQKNRQKVMAKFSKLSSDFNKSSAALLADARLNGDNKDGN